MLLLESPPSRRVSVFAEAPIEADWQEVPGLDVRQAEHLLDWLENHDSPQLRVDLGPADAWTVHYCQGSSRSTF
jgi:hypothetical protein